MCVSLSNWTFICPLSFSRFILIDGFASLRLMSIIVVIVSNIEIVNIIGSFFNDSKIFWILECFYSHLNNILEMVLMVDRANLLLFKIDDVNMCVGYVKDNNFLFIYHLEMINYMWVAVLEEEFPICIHVNDSLILSRFDHMRKNVSVSISTTWAKDFGNLLFKGYFLLLL